LNHVRSLFLSVSVFRLTRGTGAESNSDNCSRLNVQMLSRPPFWAG